MHGLPLMDGTRSISDRRGKAILNQRVTERRSQGPVSPLLRSLLGVLLVSCLLIDQGHESGVSSVGVGRTLATVEQKDFEPCSLPVPVSGLGMRAVDGSTWEC